MYFKKRGWRGEKSSTVWHTVSTHFLPVSGTYTLNYFLMFQYNSTCYLLSTHIPITPSLHLSYMNTISKRKHWCCRYLKPYVHAWLCQFSAAQQGASLKTWFKPFGRHQYVVIIYNVFSWRPQQTATYKTGRNVQQVFHLCAVFALDLIKLCSWGLSSVLMIQSHTKAHKIFIVWKRVRKREELRWVWAERQTSREWAMK